MPAALVTWLNTISAVWSVGLWRGCWQGVLLLCAVWAVCRVFPRIPAAARYWLWWLACAKFVLGAVLSPAIPLAILPSTMSTTPAHTMPIFAPAKSIAQVAHTSGPLTTSLSAVTTSVDVGASVAPVPAQQAHAVHLSPYSILLIGWFAVVGVLGASTVRRSTRLAGVIRRGRLVGAEIDAIIAEQSDIAVRAIVSDEIDGLCVAGLLRPVLLAPSTWAVSMSTEERRMAVAHELAHLRRRDLVFDVVPALASALFFFLPIVRFAARACGQAREEACDAAAIRTVSCTFAEYAAMLLKTAGDRQTVVGALGVSPAYRQLHGRLTGLASSSRAVSKVVKVAAAVLVGVGVVASAPWRLVARAAQNVARHNANSARYHIVDLGPISGDDASHFQINDLGQVVGTSNGRPVLWQAGQAQSLGTLWYHNGRGGAINNNGEYAVTCYSDAGNPHAFYASPGPHLVKGLKGYRFTVARGINDAGWIVGSAQHSGSDAQGAEIARAVLVTSGRTHDLGTLGGDHSAAYAVNAAGQIVGKADLPPAVDGMRSTHAFLWQSGQMRDLGTLGGTHSFAYAVNDQGVVAGFSLVDGDGARHACVWQTAGDTHSVDLGTLPGDIASEAHGVNDRNEVVGTSDALPDAAANRAVLWENGVAVDLNGATDAGGWHLQDAMGINNQGLVVGKGTVNGVLHAFVLMPKGGGRV